MGCMKEILLLPMFYTARMRKTPSGSPCSPRTGMLATQAKRLPNSQLANGLSIATNDYHRSILFKMSDLSCFCHKRVGHLHADYRKINLDE